MSLEYHNLMEDIVLQEVDAIMRSIFAKLTLSPMRLTICRRTMYPPTKAV